jgi:hypothetical protein
MTGGASQPLQPEQRKFAQPVAAVPLSSWYPSHHSTASVSLPTGSGGLGQLNSGHYCCCLLLMDHGRCASGPGPCALARALVPLLVVHLPGTTSATGSTSGYTSTLVQWHCQCTASSTTVVLVVPWPRTAGQLTELNQPLKVLQGHSLPVGKSPSRKSLLLATGFAFQVIFYTMDHALYYTDMRH